MGAIDRMKERLGYVGYDEAAYAPCDAQDEEPIECRDIPAEEGEGDAGGGKADR